MEEKSTARYRKTHTHTTSTSTSVVGGGEEHELVHHAAKHNHRTCELLVTVSYTLLTRSRQQWQWAAAVDQCSSQKYKERGGGGLTD